jgi:hypothetical protein
MGRGTIDPEFDEFNAWARWVAEYEDIDSPFCAPAEEDADGFRAQEP